MKKKLLFALYSMDIGGDVSSLLSMLHTIDYSQYDVDICLLRVKGDMLPYLPDEVNLLQSAVQRTYEGSFGRLKRLMVYGLKGYLFKALIYKLAKSHQYTKGLDQIMSYAQNELTVKHERIYDVAIGYVELWPLVHIVKNVNAKKKVGWIHADYTSAGFDPSIDMKNLKKLDTIVCVSGNNEKKLRQALPELKERIICIENITSSKYIKLKANEVIKDIDENEAILKFITLARIHNADKGIDRVVLAASKLKELGYSFIWYIIGDGPDAAGIAEMIKSYKVTEQVIMLGKKINPIPYLGKADVFVMTSRFEGKPIAVNEAQVMGLPVIATKYQSAHEQINHMVDGIITENSDIGIVEGLIKVLDDSGLLNKLKINIEQKHCSNEEEIEKYNKVFESGK